MPKSLIPPGAIPRESPCWGNVIANTGTGPCVVITAPANGAQTQANTLTVRGTIFPANVNFSSTGGRLLVNDTDEYTLSFTGHQNDFVVNNVKLSDGENTISAFANALGDFQSGGSLPTKVTKTGSTASTQGAAGVVTDSNGNPRALVKVKVLIDGAAATTTETNGCGYYNVERLPLGTVTTEVLN